MKTKNKHKQMKTKAEMIEAAMLPANIEAHVNKTDVKDGPNKTIGNLRVDYPTVDFFRSLPDDVMQRAIKLLAAKTLQHEASQQLRAGVAREAEVEAGAKNKAGELLKPLVYTREFNLATWLLSYEPSKAKKDPIAELIASKADAMFALLQDAEQGPAVQERAIKRAKLLEIAWPKAIADVTPAHCRAFHKAWMELEA